MLINAYYYAPHNHTLLHRHLDEDLAHMRSLGTDIVSVCIGEDQTWNWHQQRLKNVVEAIHTHGMKAHAVPNRWCGILAGWLDGFSQWVVAHPELWFTDQPSKPGQCDPRQPEVRAHFEELTRLTLEEFGFDGLIWDEPRPARQEIIDFLDEMSAFAKSVRADTMITMFANAPELGLAEPFAQTRHMDYLGADGHVRAEDHQMHRMKTTIFKTHEVFTPVLQAAGKKTYFLIEAQRHRDPDLQTYLDHVDAAFKLPMDHLGWYYSAHEMSPANENAFNEATWAAVKAAAARRDEAR